MEGVGRRGSFTVEVVGHVDDVVNEGHEVDWKGLEVVIGCWSGKRDGFSGTNNTFEHS